MPFCVAESPYASSMSCIILIDSLPELLKTQLADACCSLRSCYFLEAFSLEGSCIEIYFVFWGTLTSPAGSTICFRRLWLHSKSDYDAKCKVIVHVCHQVIEGLN